jgi:hypothetical protein
VYLREATKSCQRFVRGKLARARYARVVEGAALLNAQARGVLARKAYAAAVEAQRQLEYDNATQIQRMAKGRIARAEHKKKVAAAALINRVGRGTIARGIAAEIREVRKTPLFWIHLCIKTIDLQRQARDKHGKS